MARNPTGGGRGGKQAARPGGSARGRATGGGGGAATSPREAPAPIADRVIDAFMRLAAERPFHEIDLGDVAGAAGVSLGSLREAFDTRLGIVAGFMRRIDREVLDGTGPTTEEDGRDRLFEVLMRRIDALAPYKDAVTRILDSARRDPALGMAIHNLTVVSMRWMMAAADIRPSRPLRLFSLEGLTLVWMRTLRRWIDDAEADNGATMAALDRDLRRGQQAIRNASAAIDFLCRPLMRRWRRDGEGERAGA